MPFALFLLIIIVITVAIQFLLSFLDLPGFIIIAGFRFHAAIIIPIIFFLLRSNSEPLIDSLKNFSLKGLVFGILVSFFSLFSVLGYLFFTQNISYKEPDLFYELGLSSIVDFPIYFIWNFVEIFVLSTLINKFFNDSRFGQILVFIFLLIIFSPEHYKYQKDEFNYISSIEFFISFVIVSIVVIRFKSIYTISIILFFLFWLGLLVFGTESITLVKLFFGKNYTEWNGFFIVNKIFKPYTFLTYLSIISLIFLFKRQERLIQS